MDVVIVVDDDSFGQSFPLAAGFLVGSLLTTNTTAHNGHFWTLCKRHVQYYWRDGTGEHSFGFCWFFLRSSFFLFLFPAGTLSPRDFRRLAACGRDVVVD
jgi:hypothetical protein